MVFIVLHILPDQLIYSQVVLTTECSVTGVGGEGGETLGWGRSARWERGWQRRDPLTLPVAGKEACPEEGLIRLTGLISLDKRR